MGIVEGICQQVLVGWKEQGVIDRVYKIAGTTAVIFPINLANCLTVRYPNLCAIWQVEIRWDVIPDDKLIIVFLESITDNKLPEMAEVGQIDDKPHKL